MQINKKYIYLIIAISVFITFAPFLSNEFIYDDITLLKESIENNEITDLKSNITAYRPVRHLSYMLDYQVFGPSPNTFRLMNIIYHIAASIFLFLLISRITGNSIVALMTSLFFGLHPVQVESAAYISGRRDVLVGLFFFSAFFFILSARREKSSLIKKIAFPLIYILGMFSKENMAVLPAVLLLYDWIGKNNFKISYQKEAFIFPKLGRMIRNVKKHAGQYAFLFLTTIPFAVYKLFLRSPSFKKEFYGYSFHSNILTSVKVFFLYIWKSIFPFNLSGDYTYSVTIPEFTILNLFLAVLVTVLFVFILYKIFRRSPVRMLGFFLFFLPLFPVLHIIKPYHIIFAEHYLYISLSGLGLILSEILYVKIFLRGNKKIFYIIFLGILLGLMGLTLSRVEEWRNTKTFWTSVMKKHPENPRAYKVLGDYYSDHNRPYEAIKKYKKAIDIEPGFYAAHVNLGKEYLERKMCSSALF